MLLEMYRIFFVIFIVFLGFHQFHISQCAISYLEKEQKVGIKLHIFRDDLELALENKEKINLDIGDNKNLELDSMISKYIKEKLSIFINNQKSDMAFISEKVTDDGKAIWCNFEILDVEHIETMAIQNEILLDLYEDQKNITKIVDASGKTKHFLFEKGISDAVFSF